MKIRMAEISDAPGVAAAHMASWEVAYREILTAEIIDEWNRKRPAQWDERLRKTDDPIKTLVCDAEGEIAGFTMYGPCRDAGSDVEVNGELRAIYLAPQFWGRGYGCALWQETAKALRDAGYKDAAVWALAKNDRARSFYERVGFELQPERVKMFERGGQQFPEVRYWQALGPA
jgi:ribosomal protein S18 acetylase RimI-like enzyme